MSSISQRDESFLWVASYTTFANLAHAPRGTVADEGMTTVRLDERTGKLETVSTLGGIMNPSFCRLHPSKPLMYVATECIDEMGEVVAFSFDRATGDLKQVGAVSAQGASTCFLTVSSDKRSLLFVNYWDSTLGIVPLAEDGSLEPACHVQPPPAPVRARSLADHLADRQSEPHAHAITLEPAFARLTFVPDLGTDLIRQYLFHPESQTLTPSGKLPCGPLDTSPHGPRYIEFDPQADAAYVVNELSSCVSVFAFDRSLARAVIEAEGSLAEDKCPAVLRLAGTYTTRTTPPPATKNTCGRIAVDPSGRHLLVSNRGDDTLTSFRIHRHEGAPPTLELLAITPTEGATPRHFQFAAGGRYVIAANQDSNSLTSFSLDADTGALLFTGHSLVVNAPNFVCAQPNPLHKVKSSNSDSEF